MRTSPYMAAAACLVALSSPARALAPQALLAEIPPQARYCARLGPKQLEVLRRYRAEVETAMPDYARLDEVQAQLFQAQTGTASPAEPGETAVASLRSYVGALGKAFQYDVRAEKTP